MKNVNRKKVLAGALLVSMTMVGGTASAQTFRLNDAGYFNAGGTDVMAFSVFYPEGHQGGVCVIMNGQRIATNGDIRLEATPGQWQPVPKQLSRKAEGGRITTALCYPDSSRHLTGFNPMVYPDWNVNYTVTVEPQGRGLLVTVDLDKPVPDFLLGKVGFNLEFFPGYLFGKPEQLHDLLEQLWGREVPKTVGMFPPFHTDCGKNTIVGERVFINMGCKFQDQGGITIDEG